VLNLRSTPSLPAFPAHLVTIDPEVVSGTPVFAGTRVPVKALFDWLETETLDEFLENFPSVRREQAEEVMEAHRCHTDNKWAHRLAGSWNDLPETAEEMIALMENSRTLDREVEMLSKTPPIDP